MISASAWLSEAVSGAPEQNPEFSAATAQPAPVQAASAALEQKAAAAQGPQGAPVQVTSAAPEQKPRAAPVDWGAPVDHLRRRRS